MRHFLVLACLSGGCPWWAILLLPCVGYACRFGSRACCFLHLSDLGLSRCICSQARRQKLAAYAYVQPAMAARIGRVSHAVPPRLPFLSLRESRGLRRWSHWLQNACMADLGACRLTNSSSDWLRL